MQHRSTTFAVIPALLLVLAACDDSPLLQLQQRKVSFAEDVAPILQQHCAVCHASGQSTAEQTGFVVDSYATVMQGSRFGPVVDPGAARTSTLYNLVTGNENLTVRMPHGKEEPLSAADIETIRIWIDNGAPEN